MKPIAIIGVLLIIAGMAALVLGQVSFTRRQTVVQLGDAQINAETKDTYPIPPIAGIAAVAAGVVLVVVGYRKR